MNKFKAAVKQVESCLDKLGRLMKLIRNWRSQIAIYKSLTNIKKNLEKINFLD